MRKMRWTLALAFVLCAAWALPATAQGEAWISKDAVAAADPQEAEKSALEQKYANEARDKIDNETKRVEQSMDSLFWGIAAFVSIAAILGVLALLKTMAQARDLERLKAEVDEMKAAKPM